MNRTSQSLLDIYQAARRRFGHQHWWPGKTALEVCVGAILTQNTNWSNVEKAIANLEAAGLLSVQALDACPQGELAERIRPAGYYNVKARRLKNFIARVHEYGNRQPATGNRERATGNMQPSASPASRDPPPPRLRRAGRKGAGQRPTRSGQAATETSSGRVDGNLAAFLDRSCEALREDLLSISGIGRETADSIILYAAGKPTFVVDAYTCRILLRHGLIDAEADYEAVKELLESHLPADVDLYNDFHAQFVAVGKRYCRPVARCEGCPLEPFPHDRSLGSPSQQD